MNTIWIVLPILTLLMFDLGLTLRFEDFGKVFRRPWPIVVALFGQLVLLPIIALGLAKLFGLGPVFLHRPYSYCLLSRRKFIKRVLQTGWR